MKILNKKIVLKMNKIEIEVYLLDHLKLLSL